MKIYVSLVQDRHTDPELATFLDMDEAITYTRKRFIEVVAHPESIVEVHQGSFLLSLTYSLESDYALCAECTIEKSH